MPSKLSRKSQPRDILVANLATSLVLHGEIKTTLAKAKLVQTYVEKIFTKVLDNSLASKRSVGVKLKDKLAVAKLFNLAQKNISEMSRSGYSSIYKLTTRRGDGATIALIKLNKKVFDLTKEKPDIKTNAKVASNNHE